MNIFKRVDKVIFKRLIVISAIFLVGAAVGYGYFTRTQGQISPIPEEKNTSKAFMGEIYDKIKDNYWDNISDAQLLDLFKLSIEKNGGQILVAKFDNKDKFLQSIEASIKGMNETQKNKFLSNVAGSVLASLSPAGRSGLYTQTQEVALKNTVENINPEKDLYKDLGLAKGASDSAVNDAYRKKAEELEKKNTAEAKEELKKIAYAKDTLTSRDTKQRYDQKGIEPTIFTKQIGNILYFQFKKFSPTSLDEFQKAFEDYKEANLSSLIFDLRGNVGGAIDATAYFLGFFIGKNQYAFDFYHKGEYLPFKTPTDYLPSISKYKQIVVLVDNATQSSAEMMAASLKKYHVGVVLGVPTKGWGTVERVFQLDNQISDQEKYSMFLVHSITLRDDNQPIEGRGVEPDISIKDPDWEQNLFSYFRNLNLTSVVKRAINNPQ